MLDTSTEPNLIKTRNIHADTQIFRKDKLHIVGAIDGFVESFDSVQISLMGHPLTTDIVPDNSSILQEEILGTDFLKDNAPTDIRYDMQGFVKWYGIIISCTRQNVILIPARTAKVFYIKIKNTEVKTGLIPFALR